jgi:hypothetical protein
LELREACRVLGVAVGDSEKWVKIVFRALMREHHPDLAASRGGEARDSVDPSLLTEAYSVVLASIQTSPDGLVPQSAHPAKTHQPSPSAPHPLVAEHGGDTIWIEAPPDEAYQRLLDAAGTLGGIGHVDRNLGLLEVIVRFEGGPSCSVLMTLQGRVHGTDVFCEMESIEADPTPSIHPVLQSLVEQLTSFS